MLIVFMSSGNFIIFNIGTYPKSSRVINKPVKFLTNAMETVIIPHTNIMNDNHHRAPIRFKTILEGI